MKKLGLMIAAALLAQSVAANEVGSSYSNVAVLVAETGASSSWATKDILIAEQNAQKMEDTLEQANEKLASKLEERFNQVLQVSLEN